MADLAYESEGAWPIWKCAALAGALCAVPLLPWLFAAPGSAIAVWVLLVGLYVTLVKLFGDGFVLEGGVVVFIVSALAAIARRHLG